jgi:hypothetical protein
MSGPLQEKLRRCWYSCVIEQAAASGLGHLVVGRSLISHGAGSRPLLVVFACGAGLVCPGWAI